MRNGILLFLLVFIAWVPEILTQTAIERLTASDSDGEKMLEEEDHIGDDGDRFSVRRDDGLKRHSLGIGIGQTILSGDFKNHGENAIAPDIFYNYSVSHSFDLLINTHWSKHKQAVLRSSRNTFTELAALAIGVKGRFFQFDLFSPFAVAGLGLYYPRIRKQEPGETVPTKTKATVTFGHHLGGGVELELNNHFSLAFMGHYHNPYDIKHDTGEREVKVEGAYFKLLVVAFFIF